MPVDNVFACFADVRCCVPPTLQLQHAAVGPTRLSGDANGPITRRDQQQATRYSSLVSAQLPLKTVVDLLLLMSLANYSFVLWYQNQPNKFSPGKYPLHSPDSGDRHPDAGGYPPGRCSQCRPRWLVAGKREFHAGVAGQGAALLCHDPAEATVFRCISSRLRCTSPTFSTGQISNLFLGYHPTILATCPSAADDHPSNTACVGAMIAATGRGLGEWSIYPQPWLPKWTPFAN